MDIGVVGRIKKKLENDAKKKIARGKSGNKTGVKLPDISPARSFRTFDVPKVSLFPDYLRNSQSKGVCLGPSHRNSQISLRPSLKYRSHSPNFLNKSGENSFNTFLTFTKINLNPINSFKP